MGRSFLKQPSVGGRFVLEPRSKAMQQAELNRQVAKQLGESICEIARRGFSLAAEHSFERVKTNPEQTPDSSNPASA